VATIFETFQATIDLTFSTGILSELVRVISGIPTDKPVYVNDRVTEIMESVIEELVPYVLTIEDVDYANSGWPLMLGSRSQELIKSAPFRNLMDRRNAEFTRETGIEVDLHKFQRQFLSIVGIIHMLHHGHGRDAVQFFQRKGASK